MALCSWRHAWERLVAVLQDSYDPVLAVFPFVER